MHVHDLIGIGFGPSNLALAIALDERRRAGQPVDAMFIERQPAFAWHPDMLLSHAHMQISFLKDLATLRNPTSRFTFVNYLHEKQRLQDFINLKTFYPSRREFNDYLGWAAAQFDASCAYGEEVIDVLPEQPPERIMPTPKSAPPTRLDSQWSWRSGMSTSSKVRMIWTPAMATMRART